MNNLDFNKILDIISKMDKDELEENISKAKAILDSTNNKSSQNNNNLNIWGDLWMKIILI